MQTRRLSTRAAALAGAAAVAAAVLATGGTAQAQDRAADHSQTQARQRAAAAPVFLAPRELPPHPLSAWYAGNVTQGLPEAPFCLENALPTTGSSHRLFWTEYDTGASQIVVKAASADAAAKLAGAVERKVRDCAADWQRQNPQGTASWRDYGTVTGEDGAHVYGVHTSAPDSEPSIHLFGVGRDGSTVTIVGWGEMGGFADAPVADFQRTTTTAVIKLYA
ncbi:hypothetical protein [Streptomyces palmae]|uniref:Uncharacterized protein n=2 Tax=Streptomyces palmae TaxID=1701085 RepID=A0A4Z0HBU9_9ACTN|nr:hypothetical protein E4099_04665 [Streptomyces palmae]